MNLMRITCSCKRETAISDYDMATFLFADPSNRLKDYEVCCSNCGTKFELTKLANRALDET